MSATKHTQTRIIWNKEEVLCLDVLLTGDNRVSWSAVRHMYSPGHEYVVMVKEGELPDGFLTIAFMWVSCTGSVTVRVPVGKPGESVTRGEIRQEAEGNSRLSATTTIE